MRRATLSALTGAARLMAAGPVAAGARTLASTAPRARVAAAAVAHPPTLHARGFAATPSDEEWEDVDVLYPAAAAFVGEQAPRFDAPALVGGELGRVSLDDYLKQGKYVCLFFYPKGEKRERERRKRGRVGGTTCF